MSFICNLFKSSRPKFDVIPLEMLKENQRVKAHKFPRPYEQKKDLLSTIIQTVKDVLVSLHLMNVSYDPKAFLAKKSTIELLSLEIATVNSSMPGYAVTIDLRDQQPTLVRKTVVTPTLQLFGRVLLTKKNQVIIDRTSFSRTYFASLKKRGLKPIHVMVKERCGVVLGKVSSSKKPSSFDHHYN